MQLFTVYRVHCGCKTKTLYLCGDVEVCDLLIDEEGVGDPDQVHVVRPHHQLLQASLQYCL